MNSKSWLSAIALLLFATVSFAANEPVAGAFVRKESNVAPKAEFSPGNMTDIMPSFENDKSSDSNQKEQNEPEQEIFFSADEMETDEANSIITAYGNVVVTRGNLELICDKLWYDQKKDVIVAEGNAVLTEADGSVLYTDKITLS